MGLSLLLALPLQLVLLPEGLDRLRPAFPALIISYWALVVPRVALLPAAWLTGLALDVLYGALLGQHAFALAGLAFLAIKLSGLLRSLVAWQATLVMLPVWAAYGFLLFWIDGSTRHDADPLGRWLPLLTGLLLWWALAAIWQGTAKAHRGR